MRASDGTLLQVKCRVIEPGSRRAHVHSPFRSWTFHACVFVILNRISYEIEQAVEVPVEQVKAAARASSWVSGERITAGQIRAGLDGAVGVTARLKEAYVAMNRLAQTQVAWPSQCVC
ncbi:MAG TPA: hypothetical protein VFX61_00990 [Micromonosporaceae bacterium]|nr:hypothetical protein [Micromonosporaceae bacterium]